jgi:hypothetical protein
MYCTCPIAMLKESLIIPSSDAAKIDACCQQFPLLLNVLLRSIQVARAAAGADAANAC